ncbi:hypothetical protein [Zooshikella harenae]|uniref:Lipoprotein n=1 Tax=Zooshikella harenae TaxID=2827238 RepID=A0ABS5ZFP7_9GAMM|nr:hypothetical protein [Zooshikella harenae]MBU2711807.1 hypothetical protein [Zooshikella harenae]
MMSQLKTIRQHVVVTILLLVSFMITSGCAQQPANKKQDFAQIQETYNQRSLDSLSKRYRELQQIPGHFQGGEWDPLVDEWMGEKHRIMQALHYKLKQKYSTVPEIRKLLGEPNWEVTKGHLFFSELNSHCQDDQVTVYDVFFWRGQTDFLFFGSDGLNVLCLDWWHAGE